MTFIGEDESLGQLVHRITELRFESQSWKKAFEKAKYTIHYGKCISTSETEVNNRFTGLVEKFSIKGHCELSQALKEYKMKFLEKSRSLVHDEETNQSILKYDMLQLLLSLSSSTNQNYNYIPTIDSAVEKEHRLTWQEVLEDDPPQGDHWQTWPTDSSTSSEDDYMSDDDVISTHSEQNPITTNDTVEHIQFDFSSRMDIDEREDREGLHYLKAEQYWLDHFELVAENSANQSLLQNSCLLSSELNQLLYNEEERRQLKTITEAGAIREILSLLKGNHNILFRFEDGKFKVEETYIIQHLSRSALNNILREFCVYGNILFELRQTVTDMMNNIVYGQTSQAFAESVYKSLLNFNGLLGTLESDTGFITKDITQIISILNLRNALDSQLHYFKTIHEITRRASYYKNDSLSLATYFISALYDFVLIAQSSNQLTMYSLLVNILRKTLVPYGTFMDDWIFYGSLEGDRCKEFYVSRKDDVSMYDSDFWKTGFRVETIHQDIRRFSCPLFDPLIVERIFFTGKAVNLLSHVEKTSRFLSRNSVYKRFNDVVLEQLSKSSENEADMSEPSSPAPFSSQRETTITSVLFPLLRNDHQQLERPEQSLEYNDCIGSLLFDQHFKHHLETRYLGEPYSSTADTLNDVLHKKCELMQQLGFLASVYLMLENDLMHSFCEALFLHMDNDDAWLDPRVLNSAFINVCKTNGYDEVAQITVKEKMVHNDIPIISSFLDLIEFKVKIPWPLNNFIQEEHIPSYSKIQNFLFRLKRAKYVMEKKTLFGGNRKKTVMNSVDKTRFYSIRMKLLWFINVFWRYIMTTILHAETIHFRNELSVSKNADEIAAVHALYVRRIVDRCLLNEKANVIKKSIIKILDMTEQMKDIFVKYIQTEGVNPSEIERFNGFMNTIEYEFIRANDFISRSLMIMGKKGGFPWFENLASSLSIQ
ncbi:MAG: Spc98 family-domain-containing protein [Benjaminiella poitrasii]|nr:MAG: Spc98 family-domain-containing protein [Benjaminiella poitrasii]